MKHSVKKRRGMLLRRLSPGSNVENARPPFPSGARLICESFTGRLAGTFHSSRHIAETDGCEWSSIWMTLAEVVDVDQSDWGGRFISVTTPSINETLQRRPERAGFVHNLADLGEAARFDFLLQVRPVGWVQHHPSTADYFLESTPLVGGMGGFEDGHPGIRSKEVVLAADKQYKAKFGTHKVDHTGPRSNDAGEASHFSLLTVFLDELPLSQDRLRRPFYSLLDEKPRTTFLLCVGLKKHRNPLTCRQNRLC